MSVLSTPLVSHILVNSPYDYYCNSAIVPAQSRAVKTRHRIQGYTCTRVRTLVVCYILAGLHCNNRKRLDMAISPFQTRVYRYRKMNFSIPYSDRYTLASQSYSYRGTMVHVYTVYHTRVRTLVHVYSEYSSRFGRADAQRYAGSPPRWSGSRATCWRRLSH